MRNRPGTPPRASIFTEFSQVQKQSAAGPPSASSRQTLRLTNHDRGWQPRAKTARISAGAPSPSREPLCPPPPAFLLSLACFQDCVDEAAISVAFVGFMFQIVIIFFHFNFSFICHDILRRHSQMLRLGSHSACTN